MDRTFQELLNIVKSLDDDVVRTCHEYCEHREEPVFDIGTHKRYFNLMSLLATKSNLLENRINFEDSILKFGLQEEFLEFEDVFYILNSPDYLYFQKFCHDYIAWLYYQGKEWDKKCIFTKEQCPGLDHCFEGIFTIFHCLKNGYKISDTVEPYIDCEGNQRERVLGEIYGKLCQELNADPKDREEVLSKLCWKIVNMIHDDRRLLIKDGYRWLKEVFGIKDPDKFFYKEDKEENVQDVSSLHE